MAFTFPYSPKFSIGQEALEAVLQNLRLPDPTNDGRYNTLNHQGAMFPGLNENKKKFLEIASDPDASVLDIGTAFGEICIRALEFGCLDYVAVDIDASHLRILSRHIMENIPETKPHCRLILGAFPDDKVVQKIGSDKQFDAILAENVFHFLTGADEVQMAFRRSFELLKPGGKFFGSFATPYLKFVNQNYKDEFEEKMSVFRSNEFKAHQSVVPGYIRFVKY